MLLKGLLLVPLAVQACLVLGAVAVTSYPSRRSTRSVSPDDRELCRPGSSWPATRTNTSDRLRRLRLQMKIHDYKAYVIPTDDGHKSFDLADHDKRRQYISGFTGSAGTAVVLQDTMSVLWTDGRYFLQAEEELDCNWVLVKEERDSTTIPTWLAQNLPRGSTVGIDSRLIVQNTWLQWLEELGTSGLTLVGEPRSLVDDIWKIPQGRPPLSRQPITIHDVKYAGQTWEEKIQNLRNALSRFLENGIIVTALDEIAWLFNLRGSDIPYNPVFIAYAFVSMEHIRLYTRLHKVTNEVRNYLGAKNCNGTNCVQLKEYDDFSSDFRNMSQTLNGKILVSPESSRFIYSLVPEEKRSTRPSPLVMMKAVKNPVEVEGMKNAHIRDAVALVDFLSLLEEEVTKGIPWDEIKAAKYLSMCRAEQELSRGDSFETISAFGSNGAIIHYSPQPATNKTIDASSLYLIDSGGQYLDGTTDVTRTLHFGTPTETEKDLYTRVLIGAIDLATFVFPEGVKDVDLGIVAKRSLYEVGLDYPHGTGHGIGSFLFVHEDPTRIAVCPGFGKGSPLLPGIFTSDEPGYYEEGKFGIRLETILLVTEAVRAKPGHKKLLKFKPITLVPFEPKLIVYNMLNDQQLKWLNEYHIKVQQVVGKELRRQKREPALQWLNQKTAYVSRKGDASVPSVPSLTTVVATALYLHYERTRL